MYALCGFLFERLDGPHYILPARKVITRLPSCYYKLELVWNKKQRSGGVPVKTVL